MRLLHGIRERYQCSLRLRLVLPILSALLIVIGFLSMMSEALLSDSVQVSAVDTARKIAGLIARDPIIKDDLSNDVSCGIQERLLATLAADDLLSAVGIYGPSEEPNSNRLIHAELRHGDLACLIPATIEATARTLTHPTCDQQPDHPHDLILVTIAIDAELGSDSLLDSSPDAGTPDPDPGDLASAPTLGSVRLAYSLRAVASMKSQYRNLILMVASVLVLFAGLTADRMARSMLAPIHRVNLALQEATEGNLKVHLEETTKDELGAIAHRFNIMLRTLDANHEQIQSHNHTLEKRDLLFTLFGQLSEGLTDKPKGLGIGLALSKRIAEAHGGDLRYIHRNKRGACFRLSLPMFIPTELARG